MTATRDFVAHMAALAAPGLDAPAMAACELLALDGIAVAALGAGEAGPRILAEEALADGAGGPCTLIAGRGRAAPADAARANGAAMHVLDYEPMWNPANHAVSTTLPALLALAEWTAREDTGIAPLDGPALLRALAIGVETQARLRQASGQYEPRDLVFHPPGAVGPLGAALACGLAMGLDGAALAHAVSIAASRAGGLLANVGSMTKALHCGQAAAAGLDAARLAARGFTGDADALFSPRGYGFAFCGRELDRDALMADRAALHVVEPGPAFKFYPSQYGTHFAITAALDARAQLGPDEPIARVEIRCPLMPYVDRPAPESGLAGKFSFQYAAAAALLDGAVGVASFRDARRFAPDMEHLLAATRVLADAGREGRFDRMCLDVDVTTGAGRTVRGTCDGPPGIWGRPAAPGTVEAKARDCLTQAYGDSQAERVLGAFTALSGLDAAGLAGAIAGLRREAA